jgi:hypothetical protein
MHRPEALYDAVAALRNSSSLVCEFLPVLASVQDQLLQEPSLLLSSADAIIRHPPLDISVLVPAPQFGQPNDALTLPREHLLTKGIIKGGRSHYYSINSASPYFNAALFPAIYQHGVQEFHDTSDVMRPSDFVRQRLLSVDSRHRRNPFCMFYYDKAQKSRILGVQRKTFLGVAKGVLRKKDTVTHARFGVPVHASVKNSPAYWYAKQLNAQLLMRQSTHKPGAFVTLTENYNSAVYDGVIDRHC